MARLVASIAGVGAALIAVATAAPVPPPENTIQYGNTLYATLDNAYPLTPFNPNSTDCSAEFSFAVPAGWEIASENEETLLAIGLTPFGTNRVVLSNGKVYDHTLGVVMDGALLKMSNASVNATATPATEARPVTTGEVKIVKEVCPARILLRRIEPVDGEPVKAYQDPVKITNFITFNKTDYATIINTPANETLKGECMRDRYVLPKGWSIAPDNLATKLIAITTRYPFGYKCQVNAAGKAYERYMNKTDADCARNGTYLLKQELTALNLTLYSIPNGYCGGIMITRKSRQNDTWVSVIPQVNYTNYYEAPDGANYATLDNTEYAAVMKPGDEGCQNVPMRLGSWFQIVPVQYTFKNGTQNVNATVDPNLLAAGAKPWGTWCKSGMGTNGEPCVQNILKVNNYYSSEFCASRILIKYVGDQAS